MKLASRSPIIAQYCAHFRSVLSQGEMSAADAIERAPGYDVSNSALLGELADNALSEVEMAYENLAGAKPKRMTRKADRRSKKYARTTKARLLVRLSRSIRSIVFTPAAERRMVGIVEDAARAASASDKPTAIEKETNLSQDEFNVTASTSRVISSGLSSTIPTM